MHDCATKWVWPNGQVKNRTLLHGLAILDVVSNCYIIHISPAVRRNTGSWILKLLLKKPLTMHSTIANSTVLFIAR